MRPGRVAAGLGAAVGGLLLLRRRRASSREHVDLYYADGSMLSLESGGPESDRLLAVAREALAAVRG